MPWMLTDDVTEYLAAAGGLLRARPAENTVALTVSETLRARGPHAFGTGRPLFGWLQEGEGRVTAALLQTPPFPLLITAMDAGAAASLAGALVGHGWQPGGVNGPVVAAQEFAAAWRARTGEAASVQRRSRLFRLAELRFPAGVPGAARTAGAADRGLLALWFAAFADEVGDTHERPAAIIDERLSYGGFTLWEDGGRPVSLAGLTRRVAGQVRVGPVYTPPERRGRGYGGAVTAAVSQAALDAGADEVLLFTDLANPTSNALYQRLGYEPITDYLVLAFAPRP
jgi:predicted GNAT family acetyltransferase